MSINNSLLNDVEKLFIKFFEMYNQCVWFAYSSDYSLTDDFRKLRYHFTLNNDNGLLDDEGRQAYFQWELSYLDELNSFVKTLGYSINYKHVDQDNRGIYVSFDFSIPKEELLTKCLGRTAQLVETYASADHRSFLEFMDRHGIDASDSDALQELKTTFTNAIDYLEEDVLPKAKKFRESFLETQAKVHGNSSEAWVACAKALKPPYYEAYKVAYAAYEKLSELNPNDSYAKHLANTDEFHNFDVFYDKMVQSPNSNSLISIQMIRQLCEQRIREFLEQQ